MYMVLSWQDPMMLACSTCLDLRIIFVAYSMVVFVTAVGDEMINSAFVDGIFNMGLRCILLRFHSFGGIDLTFEHFLCNRQVNSAQISIEIKYNLKISPFPICADNEWNRVPKKAPYAFKQLRVFHLLVKCYVCCIRDRTGSRFGLMPPSLHFLGVE
jgi:hypothetical protein